MRHSKSFLGAAKRFWPPWRKGEQERTGIEMETALDLAKKVTWSTYERTSARGGLRKLHRVVEPLGDMDTDRLEDIFDHIGTGSNFGLNPPLMKTAIRLILEDRYAQKCDQEADGPHRLRAIVQERPRRREAVLATRARRRARDEQNE